MSYHILAKVRAKLLRFSTNYREKPNCQCDYLNSEIMFLELLLGHLKQTSKSYCPSLLLALSLPSPPMPTSIPTKYKIQSKQPRLSVQLHQMKTWYVISQ